MKINDNTRYPHPVLSEFSEDYKTGTFSMDITVIENPDKSELLLKPEITLDEKKIEGLVADEKAKIGFFITCPETYYHDLVTVDSGKEAIKLGPGKLRGRVQIRPIIWACKKLKGYENTNLHDEYGKNKINFPSGGVLAIDYETVIHAGREKLSPMETIFSLAINNDVPYGEIRLFMEKQKIQILANKKTSEFVHRMRGNRMGKNVLLNSIYFPAVMGVLSSLKDDPGAYEDKRWFRVFNSKCEHIGINIASSDILGDAQKLLESPFGIIMSSKELGS